jgi:hypothetical protein
LAPAVKKAAAEFLINDRCKAQAGVGDALGPKTLRNDGCFSRGSSRACVSNGGGIKGGFVEVLQDKREREEGEVRLSE